MVATAAVNRTQRTVSVPASFITFLMALVVTVACFLGGRLASEAARDRAIEGARAVTVVVQPGDTLWSIASEHPVADLSITEQIQLLRSMNGLDEPLIVPGQTLTVYEGTVAA